MKNHKKFKDICKNIKIKKTLLDKLGINIQKSNFYFVGIINDFDTKNYANEIDALKNEHIFILNENDVKIEEYNNICVNYSKVDKDIEIMKSDIQNMKSDIQNMKSDIQNMKSDIKNIQTNVKELQNSLSVFIESMMPIINHYNSITKKVDK